ncbi:hypothetical protein SNE40_013779 [Patella caerulea]|uniref:Mitotic spindle assembly checkpoint protein MAD2B n=1 Tax=Patella caerulea TaxID=87958 RepID=A0AAN8JE88_PATCE
MDAINKYQVSADILSEFVEVAIHSILYNRGLYPQGVFQRRKKYSVPVQMCLHPDVTSYICNIVESIKVLLEEGEIEKIVVVILTRHHKPIERFVFEIATSSVGSNTSDQYLLEMEGSLRSFLLKLTVCDAMLQSLPEDCTWSVHIHTRESAAGKIEEKNVVQNFPWVEADERQTLLEDPKIVPLKSMKSDYFKLQLFVEESSKKKP